MKYLGLSLLGYEIFFEKFVKPSGRPSYILNVRSLRSCFVFLYTIIYILNIASAMKKMSVNEIRDFIFENYYEQIGFSKENCCYLMKNDLSSKMTYHQAQSSLQMIPHCFLQFLMQMFLQRTKCRSSQNSRLGITVENKF